jgi:hypothetical protein
MFFAVLTWAGGFLRNARQAMLVGRRSKDTVFALFRQGLFWVPLCAKARFEGVCDNSFISLTVFWISFSSLIVYKYLIPAKELLLLRFDFRL